MKTPDFWYRPPGLAARLLTPAGRLYGLAGALRQRFATPQRAPVPVICIGNLVAGGAGKTPVALAVAETLGTKAVHFLTRGYGGRESGPIRVEPERHDATAVGDEALLLAQARPTWVARDRIAGAMAAAEAGAKIIVMDDGFQNPHLDKTLSLLVVDGQSGFGNRHLVPAGPLREPVETGLSRADALVLIGEDRTHISDRYRTRLPILIGRLEPAAETADLKGRRVLAFAGIGRPAKFFATCEDLGARLVEGIAFPDHHPYREDEIMTLVERAAAADAIPVTTVKDYVRLPAEARAMVRTVPVAVTWNDPTALARLLAPIVNHHGNA
jgi:tetraacyldisaccharide 4'-kinase